MKYTATLSLLLTAATAIAGPSDEPSLAVDAPASSATGLLLGRFTGETTMDKVWSGFTLYKDDSNPILQEFSLQGRLQIQAADGNGDTGHFASDQLAADRLWGDDIEIRRARLGFKSKWLNKFKLDGQIDVDPDLKPDIYHDIYDLYLTYTHSDALNVSVGKTKVKFSREQEISSKEIVTMERGLLSNMLFPGELTGAWVNGKGIQDHYLYELGIYSNDRDPEFSHREGDALVLAKVGYDYSKEINFDTATVGLQYMFNAEPGFTGTNTSPGSTSLLKSPNFSQSWAITNDMTSGRFGLVTEALYANGDGSQSDVYGLTIMPSVFIMDSLQLVTRFQYAASKDENDLSLASRYEGLAPDMGDKKGDEYMAAYLGLNYYIYSHKLKVMGGIEYASMKGGTKGGDYDGYTAMGGLRFSF